MGKKLLLNTELNGIKPSTKGKVRDIYDLGDKILIVATDRISAYDCVLPNGIPYKGVILTTISEYWFNHTRHIVDNHLISTKVEDFPSPYRKYKELLEGRTMLVEKTKPIPVECIVRGYLSGSAWKEYKETGSVCGIKLPSGLKEADKLPHPIFTPSTKATDGKHDINISFDKMVDMIGEETGQRLKDLSIKVYEFARDKALERGIIIADTKFEFGMIPSTEDIILIDELLTPDSSRFWLKEKYLPGHHQHGYDKQFVRDYLDSIEWNKKPPAPPLPPDIVEKTKKRYMDIARLLGVEIRC